MPIKRFATTDHETIRRWVERRRGRPSKARRARNRRAESLHIQFPDMVNEKAFEAVSWREFFNIFEKNSLAFLHQDRTLDGALSRFNLFVEKEADAEDERRKTMA